MKKKSSIRVMIMVPVLLLGLVSILSNVMAVVNLRKVNQTASIIADDYLTAITELDTIGHATQEVPRHTRLHSRGSTMVPNTSRGAPFPPPSSR